MNRYCKCLLKYLVWRCGNYNLIWTLVGEYPYDKEALLSRLVKAHLKGKHIQGSRKGGGNEQNRP